MRPRLAVTGRGATEAAGLPFQCNALEAAGFGELMEESSTYSFGGLQCNALEVAGFGGVL